MSALNKVDTPLMERYETTCVRCGWYRHFFGTAEEARVSAEKMGWEFRRVFPDPMNSERSYCPHCKLLEDGTK